MTLGDLIKIPCLQIDEGKIVLYKAFALDNGAEAKIQTDGELFYIDELEAIQECINTSDKFKQMQIFKDMALPMITLVIVKIDMKGYRNTSLIEDQEAEAGYNPETGSIQIALSNFLFKIDVQDIDIQEIKTTYEEGMDYRHIKKLKYADHDKPHKQYELANSKLNK